MLVGREGEINKLKASLLSPNSTLLPVTGRRRLGKTTLLVHWIKTSDQPYFYWLASHFPAGTLLAQFSRKVWQLGHPEQTVPENFRYGNWSEAFEALAAACQGQRKHIIILDEFPLAIQTEPTLPAVLHGAWDQHLGSSNICLVLCGSQVGAMERLFGAEGPLYDPIRKPLRLRPLPYSATAAFFPSYNAGQRMAAYAILGGVPAYLEQFSDKSNILQNLRHHLFRETSLLRTDPDYLIGEQVRDLKIYQVVLSAIALGAGKPAAIAFEAGLPQRSSADPYLARLVEMGYLHRELPVTVPAGKRRSSRLGRYALVDNYLRFYFRFVRPNLDLLAQQLPEEFEKRISGQLLSFVGKVALEELSQEWILTQARAGKMPFKIEQIGSHWGGGLQIDVVAINWEDKQLLLGATKWQAEPIGKDTVRELIETKTPRVLQLLPEEGDGWRPHYAFFSRAGFTDVARALAKRENAQLVDLIRLDQDLQAA